MHLFVGTLDNYKLDSKGRLSVPTKWRERLGKDFYMVAVTVKGCKCITLYPTEEFEKTYENMQRGTENQKYETSKDFLRNAEEGSLDAQGRFTLNQRIKELALLSNDSEVIFEGNGKTIEIWNAEEFDKMQQTFDSSLGIYDLMDKVNSTDKTENS
ncbi:MAG: hypothetical protein K1V95_05605 [Eubacterium sp.]